MADRALCGMYPKTIGKGWCQCEDERSDVGRILFASSSYVVYVPILHARAKFRNCRATSYASFAFLKVQDGTAGTAHRSLSGKNFVSRKGSC